MRKITGLLIVMFLGCALFAANLAMFDLKRAAVCKDISEREPVESADSFAGNVEKLYCFTEPVDVKKDTYIKHRWFYKDKKMAEIKLNIKKGPRWRIWSSKTILKQWTGNWRVEILDSRNNEIKTLRFEIRR